MAGKNIEPTKKLIAIRSRLDYKFGIKKINNEFVIYKNLGNGYDIIVSGLDNYSRKFHAEIAVRLLYPTIRVVETSEDIGSIEQLNLLLIITVEKYINMQDDTEYMYFLFGQES